MKLEIGSSSVAVLGIALTSTLFAGVLTGLESCLANPEKKEEVVRVQPKQVFLGESRYSPFVPEVYAIKPEEDKLVLDWREISSKYI